MAEKGYSKENFLAFIRHSAVTGLINPSTAVSRKKAAEQLLTQLNLTETQDLRQLDVDELCSRFHKLQGSTIRNESLEVYKDRLKVTLQDFIEWTDDPGGFASRQKEKATMHKKGDKQKIPTREELAREELTLNLPARPADIFPVPIREDLVVFLQNVPLDLTRKEAQKIIAVVQALADPDA